ncbi:MAG TPA: amino acid permease, partial [Candidatus Dormibacteraeota bacterium]|nr:amino acid permease [Candidatus Dormibacteraeota bacterium]
GSAAVARAQTVVVIVVIGILTLFAVTTIANLHPGYLAPSGYPPIQKIIGSVALTFFAFLGFGVVTFTARDLGNPARDLPRALFLALGTATVIYVAVSVGVFGTLTVEQVISSKGTALAVAAQPVLGDAGYWLMTVTALFATAGATNAGLYPINGLSEGMVAIGQFPKFLARRIWGRVAIALLLTAVVSAALAALFSLSNIASLGSALALVIFALVTAGHLRVRAETGASVWILILALASTVIVLVAFIFTTLLSEPLTGIAILGLLLLGVVFDFGWKRARDRRSRPSKLEVE